MEKDINWAQKRCEIARDLAVSSFSRIDNYKSIQSYVSCCVETADALIAELRKPKENDKYSRIVDMNYKTFEDLEFTPWKLDGYHAVLFFPNGYGVSVLLGDAYYSNGKDTYELAVLIGDEKEYDTDFSTPVADDVLAYISKEDVTEAMIQIQQL